MSWCILTSAVLSKCMTQFVWSESVFWRIREINNTNAINIRNFKVPWLSVFSISVLLWRFVYGQCSTCLQSYDQETRSHVLLTWWLITHLSESVNLLPPRQRFNGIRMVKMHAWGQTCAFNRVRCITHVNGRTTQTWYPMFYCTHCIVSTQPSTDCLLVPRTWILA